MQDLLLDIGACTEALLLSSSSPRLPEWFPGLQCAAWWCYTFPLESKVLRIVPIERIYKAPKYILVLVVTEYKQGCGAYYFEVVRTCRFDQTSVGNLLR